MFTNKPLIFRIADKNNVEKAQKMLENNIVSFSDIYKNQSVLQYCVRKKKFKILPFLVNHQNMTENIFNTITYYDNFLDLIINDLYLLTRDKKINYEIMKSIFDCRFFNSELLTKKRASFPITASLERLCNIRKEIQYIGFNSELYYNYKLEEKRMENSIRNEVEKLQSSIDVLTKQLRSIVKVNEDFCKICAMIYDICGQDNLTPEFIECLKKFNIIEKDKTNFKNI